LSWLEQTFIDENSYGQTTSWIRAFDLADHFSAGAGSEGSFNSIFILRSNERNGILPSPIRIIFTMIHDDLRRKSISC
jgi:hypothetical protein